MLDLRSSKHSQRRPALLARELARYDLNIVTLSETRGAGLENIFEPFFGCTFFIEGPGQV